MPQVSLLKCCIHNNHCNCNNVTNKFHSLREFTSMIQKYLQLFFFIMYFLWTVTTVLLFNTVSMPFSVLVSQCPLCSSVINSHGSCQLIWSGILSVVRWPHLSSRSYTSQSTHTHTHTLCWGDRLFPYWADKHLWISTPFTTSASRKQTTAICQGLT
jgi:hypothetical protein